MEELAGKEIRHSITYTNIYVSIKFMGDSLVLDLLVWFMILKVKIRSSNTILKEFVYFFER